MNDITKIALKDTVDPMPYVMDSLFGKCETSISNEVLDAMKKMHSYTKIIKGDQEVYTFHKRVRGTDALFSFLVTTGTKGNKVSNLECFAELGLMERHEESNTTPAKKVYVMIKGEKNSQDETTP